MPKIDVRLFASLRRYAPDLAPGEALSLEVPAGTTVREVLERLGIPRHEVKTIFVDYRAVTEQYAVQEGDRVSVFPPVAGG